MNRHSYWRRQVVRYVQGRASARMQVVCSRFFERQAAPTADDWASLGVPPAQVRSRLKAAIDRRRAAGLPARRGHLPLKLAAALLLLGTIGWLRCQRPAKAIPALPHLYRQSGKKTYVAPPQPVQASLFFCFF